MKTNRLEAFSDGVIAIIITIMVLELRVPHEPTLQSLWDVTPQFLSYLLSFAMVAIYWVNHHHLLHLVHMVDRPIMWANMLVLFSLSLMPFVTAHLGQSHAAPYSVTAYGIVSLAGALSYYLLRHCIAHHHRDNPSMCALLDRMQRKNLIAVGIYCASIAASFVWVPAALALVVLPAAMYFLPERHNAEIENAVHRPHSQH